MPPVRVKQSTVRSDDLPLEERIRRRAHELYLQRDNDTGSELEDWLQAEDEIRDMEEQKKGRRSLAEV